MLNSTELFLIYLFLWLFIFLGSGLMITVSIIMRGKKKKITNAKVAVKKRKIFAREKNPGENATNFSDMLGNTVVYHMIHVSRSQDLKVVKSSIAVIKSECERLNQTRLPEKNKKIISTVLLWANKFDIERHLAEMKIFRHSTQIVYDASKRDFKLRVKEE